MWGSAPRLPADRLHQDFIPFQSYWWCLTTADMFSSYGIATAVQSSSSSYNTVAHDTNLSHVFGVLDHFQSDSGMPCSTKVTQQWAVTQWPFLLPTPSSHLVVLSFRTAFSKTVCLPYEILFIHLSKALLLLNEAVPQNEWPLSAAFWIIIRINKWELDLIWKFVTTFAHDTFISHLHFKFPKWKVCTLSGITFHVLWMFNK